MSNIDEDFEHQERVRARDARIAATRANATGEQVEPQAAAMSAAERAEAVSEARLAEVKAKQSGQSGASDENFDAPDDAPADVPDESVIESDR